MGGTPGDTTATINTTASPGHVGQIAFDVNTIGYSDALVASNTGYQWTTREQAALRIFLMQKLNSICSLLFKMEVLHPRQQLHGQ